LLKAGRHLNPNNSPIAETLTLMTYEKQALFQLNRQSDLPARLLRIFQKLHE
jgi:hypothetical protein